MNRITENDITKFVTAVGGITQATILILNELQCSLSKAQKIAACRYPSTLPVQEADQLRGLFERHKHDIPPRKEERVRVG